MIPVRSEDRSKEPRSGWASSAMNMVGTPYRLVHLSPATASRTSAGLNPGPGRMIADPCVVQARVPSTMPKQWYRGTGMHTRSSSV